jgi:ribosomal protein S8E
LQERHDDEEEAEMEEEEEAEEEEAEGEEDEQQKRKKKKKELGGNPALHWLFRKIAYIARKPGNDERVRPTTAHDTTHDTRV